MPESPSPRDAGRTIRRWSLRLGGGALLAALACAGAAAAARADTGSAVLQPLASVTTSVTKLSVSGKPEPVSVTVHAVSTPNVHVARAARRATPPASGARTARGTAGIVGDAVRTGSTLLNSTTAPARTLLGGLDVPEAPEVGQPVPVPIQRTDPGPQHVTPAAPGATSGTSATHGHPVIGALAGRSAMSLDGGGPASAGRADVAGGPPAAAVPPAGSPVPLLPLLPGLGLANLAGFAELTGGSASGPSGAPGAGLLVLPGSAFCLLMAALCGIGPRERASSPPTLPG